MMRSGFIHGTGAIENVSLGWVPDYVRIVNLTDGDKITEAFLSKVIAFTSGGTTEIKKGDRIVGRTSGASARIRQVILDSGSWAGGDAAGWFICDAADIVGTFQAEGVDLNGVDADAATVAAQTEHGVDADLEIAAAANAISSYVGDEDNPPGFSISATVSEDGKLLGFFAMRNAPGEGQGINQTFVW